MRPRTFSPPRAQSAAEREAARVRGLILEGCLPARRAEAAALLDRYPPRLADLPPGQAGEGGDGGVTLDPRKIDSPSRAARIFLHEVVHCADTDAGRAARHDLRFAARAEGLTQRLTGSGSADRGYDLREAPAGTDPHTHRAIEARARVIAGAERYDPAADAAGDRFALDVAGLRALLLAAVPAAGFLAVWWVPGLLEWVKVWGVFAAQAGALVLLLGVVAWAWFSN